MVKCLKTSKLLEDIETFRHLYSEVLAFRLKIENALLSEMRTSMFPSREGGKGYTFGEAQH